MDNITKWLDGREFCDHERSIRITHNTTSKNMVASAEEYYGDTHTKMPERVGVRTGLFKVVCSGAAKNIVEALYRLDKELEVKGG